MAVGAAFFALFVWHAGRALAGLAAMLLVAFFLALALEPLVLWFVRRGVRRGVAAAASMLSTTLVLLGIVGISGQLFVTQVLELGRAVPGVYERVQELLLERFALVLPDADAVVLTAVERWGEELAGRALGVGSSILTGIFTVMTVGIVTYYLTAAGPRFRASICRWLAPARQREVLQVWEVAQGRVTDFITTRITLAAIATVVTVVFLSVLGTPYALPLGLFTGVVSQFVPSIGVYLGGALPAVIALSTQSPWHALGIIAFVIAYQHVENFGIAPRVSPRTLEMNPAVSLVAVIAFGAVLGWLGAFLAQPIAATIRAVATTYVHRHDLVDSELFQDPGKERLRLRWWRGS